MGASRSMRAEGPSARMGAGANAPNTSGADAPRVMPKACPWHDAPEGREGLAFARGR